MHDGVKSLACGKVRPFGEEYEEERGVGRGQEKLRTRDMMLETVTSGRVSNDAAGMSCGLLSLFDD